MRWKICDKRTYWTATHTQVSKTARLGAPGQMFARVNRGKSHAVSPNGNRQFPHSMGRVFFRAIQSECAIDRGESYQR